MGHRQKRPRRTRARARDCDVCGEEHKLHRVRLMVDGKPLGSWRCCTSCMAIKLVSLFGKKDGVIPLLPLVHVPPRRKAE